jgi:hypothetical protein
VHKWLLERKRSYLTEKGLFSRKAVKGDATEPINFIKEESHGRADGIYTSSYASGSAGSFLIAGGTTVEWLLSVGSRHLCQDETAAGETRCAQSFVTPSLVTHWPSVRGNGLGYLEMAVSLDSSDFQQVAWK